MYEHCKHKLAKCVTSLPLWKTCSKCACVHVNSLASCADVLSAHHSFLPQCLWGGTGGRKPGSQGGGKSREVGEEGVGGGVSKEGGSREKWEKFCNIGTIFRNRKSTQRQELLRKGAGAGIAGCRRWEVQTPLSPPPPPPHMSAEQISNFCC